MVITNIGVFLYDEGAQMSRYRIHLDDKFGQLRHIDITAEAANCAERWFNQTLTTVNESVVRLGVVEGEFHWHEHEREDEFFVVLEGELQIDVQGAESVETIVLGPHQGVTIPRGVRHRPRAPHRTVMLMVEPSTIAPTGDE
jgi:mannose-6-phosphate isomerase-like protein (cupin superfamily)